MLRNLLSTAILAFICAFSINEISAQENKNSEKTKEKHRVVIVKKVMDEDGKMVDERVVKEGEEAKEYIEFIEKAKVAPGEEHETIEKDGVKYRMVKSESHIITKKLGDNEEEVIEWNGEGEMPEDIKKFAEEEMKNFHPSSSNITINRTIRDGIETVEVEMDGDEMPEGMLEFLKEQNIDISDVEFKKGKKIVKERTVGKGTGKAQLGVMIDNVDNGVRVDEVVKGSAADEAGLKENDIITKINDKKIEDTDALIKRISGFKPNDIINISFLRNDREVSRDIILKELMDPFPIKSWNDVIIKVDREEDK